MRTKFVCINFTRQHFGKPYPSRAALPAQKHTRRWKYTSAINSPAINVWMTCSCKGEGCFFRIQYALHNLSSNLLVLVAGRSNVKHMAVPVRCFRGMAIAAVTRPVRSIFSPPMVFAEFAAVMVGARHGEYSP